jgi:hypothetical protein
MNDIRSIWDDAKALVRARWGAIYRALSEGWLLKLRLKDHYGEGRLSS